MLCYLRLDFAAADKAAEAAGELLVVGALCVRQGIVATPHLHSVAQHLSSAQQSSCTSEPVPSCPKSLMPQASTSPALLEQACISHCPARLGIGDLSCLQPRSGYTCTECRARHQAVLRLIISPLCKNRAVAVLSSVWGAWPERPTSGIPTSPQRFMVLLDGETGGGLPDRSRRTAALCSTAASMCSVSV